MNRVGEIYDFQLETRTSSNKKFKNYEISLLYLGVTRKQNIRNIPKLAIEYQGTYQQHITNVFSPISQRFSSVNITLVLKL